MLFILTVITVVWMLGDQTPIIRLVYTHLPRLLRGCLYAGYALLAFSLFVALGGSRGARARPSLGAGMAAPGGGSRRETAKLRLHPHHQKNHAPKRDPQFRNHESRSGIRSASDRVPAAPYAGRM